MDRLPDNTLECPGAGLHFHQHAAGLHVIHGTTSVPDGVVLEVEVVGAAMIQPPAVTVRVRTAAVWPGVVVTARGAKHHVVGEVVSVG